MNIFETIYQKLTVPFEAMKNLNLNQKKKYFVKLIRKNYYETKKEEIISSPGTDKQKIIIIDFNRSLIKIFLLNEQDTDYLIEKENAFLLKF
ncbi:hypothetical protein BpHYR1_043977 [Brachionus plicatilis]|uniref:Uncharacterized protein n=1 Tax=Brachionus plicatilis TaxID=10195 RepID=A0A3M7RRE7_BRAPC|nr:hypothetical protein BpHYR1_043977 [Brachionus plicatilis]